MKLYKILEKFSNNFTEILPKRQCYLLEEIPKEFWNYFFFNS